MSQGSKKWPPNLRRRSTRGFSNVPMNRDGGRADFPSYFISTWSRNPANCHGMPDADCRASEKITSVLVTAAGMKHRPKQLHFWTSHPKRCDEPCIWNTQSSIHCTSDNSTLRTFG